MRWLGYSHVHDSWEDEESILDPALIRAFEGQPEEAEEEGEQGEQDGWLSEGHAWLRRRVARSFGDGAEAEVALGPEPEP